MIDAIKRQLHRDICRDPVLHGLVLNFYLNGEEYPDRVAGYFPGVRAEEPEIAVLLARHLQDERKHVALYAKTLQQIEQPRLQFPLPEIYNSIILAYTAELPRIPRVEVLAGFFAHLHFLEKRIAHSLEIHLDACAFSPSPYPGRAVGVVLRDEQHHRQYTLEVVKDLLPTGAARRVLAHHRRAEARANLVFSARQLGMLTRTYAERFPRLRRPVYRLAATLQESLVNAI